MKGGVAEIRKDSSWSQRSLSASPRTSSKHVLESTMEEIIAQKKRSKTAREETPKTVEVQ